MNTQQLQQELHSTFTRAERNRRILKISQLICYGGATIWFIGIFALNGLIFSGGGSLFMHDYEANPNPTFWETNKILVVIIPLFALIMLGSMGLGYFYKKFTADEQNAVRRIIKQMFPDAKCYLEGKEAMLSQIYGSRFFDGIARHNELSGYIFGNIVFELNGRRLNIQDLAVHKTASQSTVSGYLTLFKVMFGGAFAKRVENVTSDFRGLFANAKLAKAINGSIVIFPDHLEQHLDYLARSLQSLKSTGDCKLVQLEDPEFERYFAVYATDEITARYVLTPAMMLRMTELRRKYNRDIMLSFSGDQFYFAVSMPEGFLTLGGNTDNAVYDLYDNIEIARTILKELRLDKGVVTKKEIVL
ncbi:hypothetical protein FACS189464_2120 [Bacteroidia bacterium]|nr:hypothetical protein FACS189464_2120 [Bacteroidia bacterium]